MRHFISGQRFCALVAAISAATFSSMASAAFLTVTGGPTYSQTSGGYLPATGFYSISGFVANGFLGTAKSSDFGAVNDAGVAVANVNKLNAPLNSTPMEVSPTVVRWSATAVPVELMPLVQHEAIQARAMNNAGAVVGVHLSNVTETISTNSSSSSSIGSGMGARLPTATSAIQYLDSFAPTLPPLAFAINESGQIVGGGARTLADGTVVGRAIRWEPSSTAGTELGMPGSDPNTTLGAYAIAVNRFGAATGRFGAGAGQFNTEPIRWDAAGTATLLDNLGTPPGAQSSASADWINDAGTAVGYAKKYNVSGIALGSRGIRWDASGAAATELGTLGLDANGKTEVVAIQINNAGAIMGKAFKSGSSLKKRGVLWPAGSTTAIELRPFNSTPDVFGSEPTTTPYDINDSGLIVGESEGFGGSGRELHAVYWLPDGSPVDLNSLISPTSGWTLTRAEAISNTGWIMGIGSFDPDGAGSQAAYSRMFLLQVPEPSAVVLGALGVVAAFIVRRRR